MKYCGGFSFFAAYCGSFEIAAHCTSLNDLIWMKQNIFVCFESDFNTEGGPKTGSVFALQGYDSV